MVGETNPANREAIEHFGEVPVLAELPVFSELKEPRSWLGTINHTCLSLQALKAAGVPVLGVVMVGETNPANREAIEHFGEVPVLAELPVFSELKELVVGQQAGGQGAVGKARPMALALVYVLGMAMTYALLGCWPDYGANLGHGDATALPMLPIVSSHRSRATGWWSGGSG